jgi:glycosyltransferase involved in cell wall biosynthesis
MLRNLTRAALVERYRTALLTVHLGVAEPFGLVPLESMAAGTAVLAEGNGGAREILVEGTTGWAVEDIDEPTLADRLAAVPRQREKLVEMGQAATRHALEAFRPEESLARLKARLEELASGS